MGVVIGLSFLVTNIIVMSVLEKTGEVNKITNVLCIVFLILTLFPERMSLKKFE